MATRATVLADRIEQRVFFLRGQKVMLSPDLAHLYNVQPRALVQAVKRNLERFPADFMFQLNHEEFLSLKSQIVTSIWGGLRRAAPYAFTEQGVAMLSSVLHSKRAIQVNGEVMRAFVRLRQMLASYANLPESSMRSRKNTTPSSRSSSTPSAGHLTPDHALIMGRP